MLSQTEGTVQATLRNEEGSFVVALDPLVSGAMLTGSCSRCMQSFGPCVHIVTLALDLAAGPDVRFAVIQNRSAREAIESARERRKALAVEQRFDQALKAWLAPGAGTVDVEIAASPYAEGSEAPLWRAYGDRPDAGPTRAIALFVRKRGERKLLTPREMTSLSDFSSRDRRILEHASDRGSGRKAVYALGVRASLALEAMRLHGGILNAGYKGLLDFRPSQLRPSVALKGEGELAAFWVSDDGAIKIPFEDGAFFPGPFPYVWRKEGSIHRVAADVDLGFAAQFASSPTLQVPDGKMKDAGAQLLRATRGRGIQLPASETFGLPPIEAPRFVLRLSGAPLDFEGELVAVYRAREIKLFDESETGIPEDGRDVEGEAQAKRVLSTTGLVRERELSDDEDEPDLTPRIGADGESAVDFWTTGLLSLRNIENPRIEVELSKRLANVRVGAPLTSRVHVVLEGDWLKARLEFSSKELPVEMAQIREALKKKDRWISLSDGTLTRISASIETLIDEANDVLGGKPEAKLAPHQLGRIDRWIEENDGRMDAAVKELRRRLRSLAVDTEPQMPKGLDATLRPYQLLGLSWLQFLQALGAGGILADDMGLGKTIMTLAFLLKRKEDDGPAPSLVVCPTSVATNWIREAQRFTPDLKVHLLHGPTRQTSAIVDCDVAVTTYALLRRDIEALSQIKFRTVVLDEAQNIKNSDSETRRAAIRLDAQMKLALSGTPVENRLRELWSIASFANPGILGTARSFETRYEKPIAMDHASPLSAELRAIVRPFLLRRTKNEVLTDLPPKTEIDRYVTLTAADKRMYDALAHTLRESVARDQEKQAPGHHSLSVFTALTRLRQMACDPGLVEKRLTHARSAKRETFLSIVRELVAEGRRALVFSQFVQLLTLWRADLDAEGIRYEYLDGSTTKRDEVVSAYQEGTAPLFLISLKAGGAGLNLTAADTVIHCDPWWNPAVEDQATDRAHRIGQDKPVTVIRLIARGTIEEKILALKAKKRKLVDAVVQSDAAALSGITEEDLRVLLGDAEDEEDGPDDENAPVSTSSSGAPTDVLATAKAIVDPEFNGLVSTARLWMETSGMLESEIASLVDLPIKYVTKLLEGKPFPCSRAVAERIRARMQH